MHDRSSLRSFVPLLICASLLCTACGGPRAVQPPPIKPADAARLAMEQLDTNKDGLIDAAELERSPGLRAGLKGTDRDNNGKIGEQELADRLTTVVESQLGAIAFPVQVTRGGSPVVGAVVTLTPEPFLKDVLKPATGTTDATGTAFPETEGVPGVAPGYYRVETSQKGADGQESLPARYNTETRRGCEVFMPERGQSILAVSLDD